MGRPVASHAEIFPPNHGFAFGTEYFAIFQSAVGAEYFGEDDGPPRPGAAHEPRNKRNISIYSASIGPVPVDIRGIIRGNIPRRDIPRPGG